MAIGILEFLEELGERDGREADESAGLLKQAQRLPKLGLGPSRAILSHV